MIDVDENAALLHNDLWYSYSHAAKKRKCKTKLFSLC